MYTKILFRSLIILFFIIPNGFLFAQRIDGSAWWVAPKGSSATGYGVYHVRNQFTFDTTVTTFPIYLSADNRYILSVNGKEVMRGPARNSPQYHQYDSIDLLPYLVKGNNVIGLIIMNFGYDGMLTSHTGFFVQGAKPYTKFLNTHGKWLSKNYAAYAPAKNEKGVMWYIAPPAEICDTRKLPQNWDKPDFDASDWKPCYSVTRAQQPDVHYYEHNYQLYPRAIPFMETEWLKLGKIVRQQAVQKLAENSFSDGKPLTFSPNTENEYIIDMGELVNAYPILNFSGGEGATVVLGYAEALYEKLDLDCPIKGIEFSKGNRNVVGNKKFVGVRDTITLNGLQNQTHKTLWWKSFRFLLVKVITNNKPVTINKIEVESTLYPFKFNAKFVTSNKEANKQINDLLTVGWRTARRCAHETYMDCPYYEQLQYIGDGRIQAMVSVYNSGDLKLMRNALVHAYHSRQAEGITQSRFPGPMQYIPPFSLFWIDMLHDYLMYAPDGTELANQLKDGVYTTLSYYQKLTNESGLLTTHKYWNFTDWAWDKRVKAGVFPKSPDGNSCILDLQYLYALQMGTQIMKSVGDNLLATMYNEQAKRLAKSIYTEYYNNQTQYFEEYRESGIYTQHSQSMAVLCGLIDAHNGKRLMERTLTDTSLIKCTIYFKYYLHQAAAKMGLGGQYLTWLDTWYGHLNNGCSTWPETPEPSRSDCHAWGSSPNIEVFRIIAGIESAAPEFSRVNISPNVGNLSDFEAVVPHHQGKIEVSYKKVKGKELFFVTLPKNVLGTITYKGLTLDIKSGEQSMFEFSAPK